MSSASNRSSSYFPSIKIGKLSNSDDVRSFLDDFIDQHRGQYRKSVPLSKECKDIANEVYDSFKRNKEDLVNEENFVNHWQGLQARISATEFFASIDHENSGAISRHHFIAFWESIKAQGTNDDEIVVLL